MDGFSSTKAVIRNCPGKCCSAIVGDVRSAVLVSSCRFTIANSGARGDDFEENLITMSASAIERSTRTIEVR